MSQVRKKEVAPDSWSWELEARIAGTRSSPEERKQFHTFICDRDEERQTQDHSVNMSERRQKQKHHANPKEPNMSE